MNICGDTHGQFSDLFDCLLEMDPQSLLISWRLCVDHLQSKVLK
jgi:hypothetical protein